MLTTPGRAGVAILPHLEVCKANKSNHLQFLPRLLPWVLIFGMTDRQEVPRAI